MKRLIYDGKTEHSDNSILYMFISANLDDAQEIFYKLYEDDINSVAEDYKSDEEDELYGLTISIEVKNKDKSVISVSLSISISNINEDVFEYEICDLELDDEDIEILLNKVSGN